jgi:hypothetical protein
VSKRKNNEIFSADQSSNVDTQENLNQKNMIPNNSFGWEIPCETIPLPSQGTIYTSDSFFYGKKTIDIKAMTAKEEDILMSQALIKKGTVIEELIKSCVMDRSANVDDLILGDRNALSIAIRITGYGSDYNAEVTCPKCNHKNQTVFDLSDLEIKRLGASPIAQGTNLFEFVLPVSKKVIIFKLLTGADEREKESQDRSYTKALGPMSLGTITSNLRYIIQSIDEITDKGKIYKFIDMMPAMDSKKLREYIVKIQPGINMSAELTCESCGSSSPVSLPITSELFWPS